MTLGQKIKYYREKQKISQEHLAELSHISVSTIRKYESGERKPKEEQIEKIAHSLHISPAALKDYKCEDIVEIFPLLYSIGLFGDIQFVKGNDICNNDDPEELLIKFNNSEIMDFFRTWAAKKEEMESVKKALSVVKDAPSKKVMENRLEELMYETENELVLDRINKLTYSDEEPLIMSPIKSNEKELAKLTNYKQIIDVLYTLAISVKYECVGVWERVWEPKAIITFDAESVETDGKRTLIDDTFKEFVHYFYECKEIGIETEYYMFTQGGKKYYRYIIKDRVLATAMDLINEVIEFSWFEVDEKERNAFRIRIAEKLKKYDRQIGEITS